MGSREAGVVLESDALDQARQCIADAYASHDLVLRERSPLRFRLRQAPADRLTVGKLSYGTGVELIGPPMTSCYHINLPIEGHTDVTQHSRNAVSGPRVGIALIPSAPVRVRWEPDAVQYPIRIPRVALEEHLAGLLGRPVEGPLDLDLGFPLDTPAGRSLLSCVEFVWSELSQDGGVAALSAGRRQLEALLMTRVLWAIPHQYSEALAADDRAARPTRIQKIIELIEAHPESDLGTEVLAARAGVSARALQSGFRKVTGVSPGTYVRNVRLDRIHGHLVDGTSEPIIDLAFRYGFGHLGRFAQKYRERFGVRPSDTGRHGTARRGISAPSVGGRSPSRSGE